MTGRPSTYTPELGAEICDLIAEGYTLRQIGEREGMPWKSTVNKWRTLYPDFEAMYARAKAMQADHMAEEIIEIADDGSNDWMTREQENGGTTTVLDHEHVQRSKLRVDARKWVMAKMAPRKYGDQVAITGADGGNLVVEHELTVTKLMALLTAGAPLTIEGTAPEVEK